MDNHDRSMGPKLEARHCLRTKNDNFYYNYVFFTGVLLRQAFYYWWCLWLLCCYLPWYWFRADTGSQSHPVRTFISYDLDNGSALQAFTLLSWFLLSQVRVGRTGKKAGQAKLESQYEDPSQNSQYPHKARKTAFTQSPLKQIGDRLIRGTWVS